jgi:hypothetical protein
LCSVHGNKKTVSKKKTKNNKKSLKRVNYRSYVLGTRNTLTIKKKVYISEILVEEFHSDVENNKVNPMSRKQVFTNLFKIYKRADKLPKLI